jgi:hypothetical protein
MQTFKMLRKHGTGFPFPFNENLAKLDGMVMVEMTAAEVRKAAVGDVVVPKSPEQIDTPEPGLKTLPTDKPGPGWILRGNKWVRKTKVAKATEPDESSDAEVPEPEV